MIFLAVESAKLKLPTQAETTKNTKGMQKFKGRGVPYLPLKQIHTHTHTNEQQLTMHKKWAYHRGIAKFFWHLSLVSLRLISFTQNKNDAFFMELNYFISNVFNYLSH